MIKNFFFGLTRSILVFPVFDFYRESCSGTALGVSCAHSPDYFFERSSWGECLALRFYTFYDFDTMDFFLKLFQFSITIL